MIINFKSLPLNIQLKINVSGTIKKIDMCEYENYVEIVLSGKDSEEKSFCKIFYYSKEDNEQ